MEGKEDLFAECREKFVPTFTVRKAIQRNKARMPPSVKRSTRLLPRERFRLKVGFTFRLI